MTAEPRARPGGSGFEYDMDARLPFKSFVDVIESRLRSIPDERCLWVHDTPITWRELGLRTERVRDLLCPAAIAPPRRVALLIDEPDAFLYALFGVLRLGCTAIPIPGRLREATIAAILRDCAPGTVLASDRHIALLERTCSDARFVSADELRDGTGSAARSRPSLAAPAARARVDPDREMIVMYSSGTTAAPKGVVHTQRTRCCAAVKARRGYYLDERERTLIAAPLDTARALAPLLATAYAGGESIIVDRFEPAAFMDVVKRRAPTTVDLVPTQFRMLMSHERFDPAAFASCRFVLSGGAGLDSTLRDRLFAAFPDSFIEGYGSTETDSVSRLPRRAPLAKRGSVGTARDALVRILGGDDAPVGEGEVGEIVVCTPSNMVGYCGNGPEAGSLFWVDPATGKRFLRTGDLGSLDGDGFLWLAGRKKDMIITAGFNIFPADLEDVLLQHPAVAEAAVVGVPHEVLGETPLAFVVLRETAGPDERDPHRICRWANARLNGNQRLYDVRLANGLPRNANGKVLKSRLRELTSATVSALRARETA